MASFTGAGDNLTLFVQDRDVSVMVNISGTYNMEIALQREIGSKGSGVWQTVELWDTENATVAFQYITQSYNEHLRLIVLVDTTGTAVATLEAKVKAAQVLTDKFGETLVTYYSGGVVPELTPVSITASITLNRKEHAFRPLVFNVASGATATLPAATGSGDEYWFYVGTTVTSNAAVINASTNGGLLNGVIVGVDDEAEFTWGSAVGADDTISLGGTAGATGGSAGDYVKVVDIASGLYHASGMIHHGTGTEANPFSTAA